MVRRAPKALLQHPYLLHLRLPFNMLLSPVYLWGVFLAGGSLTGAEFWLGYMSLHLFLYGGTTAFNSYFDRDEGPVGGMLRPPPVDVGLLRFSLMFQAAGLFPAVLVGIDFLLAWLLLFLIFFAYSSPPLRLKRHPATALTAIALGQGAIGFALGWLIAAPASDLASATGLIGMASTALVVSGLYLVSQSYQGNEDARRGDRTLAVLLGGRASLLLALAPLGAGGGLVTWRLGHLAGWAWAAGLAAFFLVIAARLTLWALRFEEQAVAQNFRIAMLLIAGASLGLSLVLLVQLAAQ